MALENILEKIKKEAELEAKKIKENGKNKIKELEREYQEKMRKEKEKILAESEKEAEKKIEQAKFILESKKKSEILKKKQAVLQEIFKTATEEIAKMTEEKQVEILKELITNLPEEKEVKLIPTKSSYPILKKALEKSGRKFQIASETLPGKGGFVFSSPRIEIDNRYSVLVEQIRHELETEVAKNLFS